MSADLNLTAYRQFIINKKKRKADKIDIIDIDTVQGALKESIMSKGKILYEK